MRIQKFDGIKILLCVLFIGVVTGASVPIASADGGEFVYYKGKVMGVFGNKAILSFTLREVKLGDTVRVLEVISNDVIVESNRRAVYTNRRAVAKLRIVDAFEDYSVAVIDNYGHFDAVSNGMIVEKLSAENMSFYKDYRYNQVSFMWAMIQDYPSYRQIKYTHYFDENWGVNIGLTYMPAYLTNINLMRNYGGSISELSLFNSGWQAMGIQAFGYGGIWLGGTYRIVYGDFDYLGFSLNLGYATFPTGGDFGFSLGIIANIYNVGIIIEYGICGTNKNNFVSAGVSGLF